MIVLGLCVRMRVCFGVNEWMRTVKLFVRRHVIAHALVNYAQSIIRTHSSPDQRFFLLPSLLLGIGNTTNFSVLNLTATIVRRARRVGRKKNMP